MTRILINMIGFNAVWFASVLGAASGRHWLGPLSLAVFLVVHLRLNGPWRNEVVLALIAGAIGFGLDTLLIATGMFEPVRWILPAPLSTVWLVMMWVNFALILNVSLKRLQEMPLLAVVLGALGGPGAYFGGVRLGALEFGESLWVTLLVLAVAWAVVTPMLLRLARFLNR